MGIVTAQWSPVNIRKHHFLSNLKESINTGIRNTQFALWIERNKKKMTYIGRWRKYITRRHNW
jgi:hypothetical protein